MFCGLQNNRIVETALRFFLAQHVHGGAIAGRREVKTDLLNEQNITTREQLFGTCYHTTIVSLLERLRDEVLGSGPRAAAPDLPVERVAPSTDTSTRESNAYARLAMLEGQFENLNRQFALVLQGQEELANSIAFVFEQHMRTSGWTPGCSDNAT